MSAGRGAGRLEQLSPAMLSALGTLAGGAVVDGRSWRALNGLKARGLVVSSADGWTLTDAGRAVLEAQS